MRKSRVRATVLSGTGLLCFSLAACGLSTTGPTVNPDDPACQVDDPPPGCGTDPGQNSVVAGETKTASMGGIVAFEGGAA